MKKYIFLVVIIFSIFFPKFYFNFLENKSQVLFTTIEEARDKNDFKKVKALLLTHKSIVNNQKIIIYLLPKKYDEFYKLKDNLFNKYYLALEKFVVLKEYENGLEDVFSKRNEFIKTLNNSKDQKVNAMDVYIALNTYISQKEVLTKHLKDGFISQDLYDGFLQDFEKSIS